MIWHPAWIFAVDVLVAAGTLGLAAITFMLSLKTKEMAEASRKASQLSVQPLLADPRLPISEASEEQILFGAPGRISPKVPYGKLFYHKDKDGRVSHFSLAFENIGAGTAAIHSAKVEPPIPGDIYISRKFVPVGSLLRVNVSVLPGLPGSKQFEGHWWAMEGIEISVDYSDVAGGETLTSTASIRQYAVQDPFVREITIRRAASGEILAIGQSSY
ncbi:MAG: hypothetical protein JRN15_14555 [Nitrososphaerota archaeon]|nr:hypothetical protein [Nitrososphaerota archaeon]